MTLGHINDDRFGVNGNAISMTVSKAAYTELSSGGVPGNEPHRSVRLSKRES